MGKGRTQRSRKRKFYGNQNTNRCNVLKTDVDISTASCKKLRISDDFIHNNNVPANVEELSGNRIIDMEILISVFSILCCPVCFNNTLYLKEDSTFGLSSQLCLKCKQCEFIKVFSTSKKINKCNEINSRFVYGLRIIGKGFSAGKKLCSILNLRPFISKLAFRNHEKKILQAATLVAENSMNEAAKEVRVCSQNIITDCGISVDGTWQRRGFSSLNGCVTAISIDTGKVLDFEIMSQYCRVCKLKNGSSSPKEKGKHTCSNHKGSAGSMEPVGVYRIFERSTNLRMLRYTSYYGDGDCKAFETVKNMYGKGTVIKQECIGHIQKRVGARLRKLKKNTKGIGGKGKLTDNFIDKLQNYYGISIRSNVGDLKAMQSAVIAAFFHCCSSKDNPKHGQCPTGTDSWCKYQRAKSVNKTIHEKSTGLPQSIINKVKPVYMELCDQVLLKKCLHGKTQNANEAFNGVLWQILPKEVFVELETLRLGASLAVIQFNNGFRGLISVLDKLGITPGCYTLNSASVFDGVRIADSQRHSLPFAKSTRRKLRASRKKKIVKNEEKEGISYKSGEF